MPLSANGGRLRSALNGHKRVLATVATNDGSSRLQNFGQVGGARFKWGLDALRTCRRAARCCRVRARALRLRRRARPKLIAAPCVRDPAAFGPVRSEVTGNEPSPGGKRYSPKRQGPARMTDEDRRRLGRSRAVSAPPYICPHVRSLKVCRDRRASGACRRISTGPAGQTRALTWSTYHVKPSKRAASHTRDICRLTLLKSWIKRARRQASN